MTRGEGEGEWNVVITIIREMVQLMGASDTGLGMQARSDGAQDMVPPGTQALGGEIILHSGQVGSEHFPPPAALWSQTQWVGH